MNFTDLEAMFARRKMYIKSRMNNAMEDEDLGAELTEKYNAHKTGQKSDREIKTRPKFDLPDHRNEFNECKNDDQKYRLLKQLESTYTTTVFNKRVRDNWPMILGQMIGQDARVVKRIFATTTFATVVMYRFEQYHGIRDLDVMQKISEKMAKKISIKCYCGGMITPSTAWHLHHCHDCGQIIGICHAGCNTNEPNSMKVMDWMFGPGIISRVHEIAADRYDPPILAPEDWKSAS